MLLLAPKIPHERVYKIRVKQGDAILLFTIDAINVREKIKKTLKTRFYPKNKPDRQ